MDNKLNPENITVAVLTVTGRLSLHSWARRNVLAAMQSVVGGNVEAVDLAPTLTMWLNEEGLYGEPANSFATRFAATYGVDWQVFHGAAVFTGGCDDAGEVLSLTEEHFTRLSGACLAITSTVV